MMVWRKRHDKITIPGSCLFSFLIFRERERSWVGSFESICNATFISYFTLDSSHKVIHGTLLSEKKTTYAFSSYFTSRFILSKYIATYYYCIMSNKQNDEVTHLNVVSFICFLSKNTMHFGSHAEGPEQKRERAREKWRKMGWMASHRPNIC